MRLPEQQLLLLIARQQLDEETQIGLRDLVESSLDWKLVYESAQQHGLLPLLYRHLVSACRESIPSEFLQTLQQEFESNNKRNLGMMQQLLKLLALFQANRIDVITLKGPLLAERVYGDLGLRTVADIDLLIRENEFDSVRALLQQAGYLMEPQLRPEQIERHLEFHCEIQFVHSELDVVVDLHWALAPQTFSGALETAEVFRRKQQIMIAGKEVDILSREDELLFLSMHAAKHYWSQLEWFAAIAELLRHSESLGCAKVLARARQAKAQTMLLLAFAVVNQLLEVRLPTELQRTLEDKRQIKSGANLIEQRLFQQRQTPDPLEMFRLNLIAMDRRSDALAALLRSTFTPTISDWELISFPKSLYAIYYLFRPVRLTVKYIARGVTKPFRFAKSNEQATLSQRVFNR
jgi:hypothetical protein